MILMYCDLETTGLSPETDSIVQCAGILVANGQEKEFDFKIKPYKPYQLSHSAKWKTGLTEEIIEAYPDQSESFSEFCNMIDEVLNRNPGEKIHFCGYNSTSFDMAFLRNWFAFNNNRKFGLYFYFPSIDAMHLAAFYLMGERAKLPNFQLGTVYEHLTGKRMEVSHEALADIKATREILQILTKAFWMGITNYKQMT